MLKRAAIVVSILFLIGLAKPLDAIISFIPSDDGGGTACDGGFCFGVCPQGEVAVQHSDGHYSCEKLPANCGLDWVTLQIILDSDCKTSGSTFWCNYAHAVRVYCGH